MREAGIALLLSSFILALFLLIPTNDSTTVAASGTDEVQVAPDSFDNVVLNAKAAVVYDFSHNSVIFSKNADAQLPLASLTKLLTVYAALAELSPKTPITVSKQASGMESPHALRAGESFTLENLARLTLTASLNDGATAIAEATAERAQSTTKEMLASAATSLHLSETYALNGTGLDLNSTLSGGYGSAHDLAVLAGELVKAAPGIALATTEASATAVSEEGRSITVKNTNPKVVYAPRLLLSKTGYTDLAGGNLVLVFDAGIDHPVAVVVLGSSEKERFTDASALVAATLAHFAGVASL